MNALERLEKIKKTSNSLMKSNQDSYIRDKETTKPIGVKWDLEKHSELFHQLHSIQQDLDWILQDLRHIY